VINDQRAGGDLNKHAPHGHRRPRPEPS